MGIGTNLYDELDRPRMGMVRESIWKDPLFVKYELGKVKRSIYQLPDKRFIYGMINPRDAEGVREVIQHRENEYDPEGCQLGPNFIAMNKISALKNCVTCPEVRKCRDQNYVKLLPKSKLANRFKLPSELDPTYTYGAENVIGPSMDLIMRHAYQDEWIKMNQWLFENHPDVYTFVPIKWKPSPTNSSILRAEAAKKLCSKPPGKPRFCMDRFKNIKKRIDNECNIPFIRDRTYPNITHWCTPTIRCSHSDSKCDNTHVT